MRSAGFPVTYGGGRYAADTLDLPPVSRYGAGGYRRGYSGYNGGLELAAGRYAPTYLSDSVHRTYSGGYYGGAGMGSQVVDMKDTRNFYKPGVYTEARSDGRTDLPDVEVVVHPPHGSPPARSMQVSVTRPRPEFATTAGYRDVEQDITAATATGVVPASFAADMAQSTLVLLTAPLIVQPAGTHAALPAILIWMNDTAQAIDLQEGTAAITTNILIQGLPLRGVLGKSADLALGDGGLRQLTAGACNIDATSDFCGTF
eukprot:CAMPEP_0174284668 /NCGR_PEP_ID=MMETSP0809-20121228/6305_1 /TAXON_ID=73025 ORGANISM="Eutreptiella gymnastica-like, Strain CCMP1594" /NCGR_SAMPLE_ID=MMETSP0809 /ASSEMBLY_ACC=CAM_ASM_000658 /LENGTH=258 /DNA_ID=CAMNT_0015380249 /DNA_START=81 /DNA_END=859 /DNA_ORIENTATION=+